MLTLPMKRKLPPGLSVTQDVYVRSRYGAASKIVSEHYLRTDIPCYSKACRTCPALMVPDATGKIPESVLSATPIRCGQFGAHYVVLDTNIVLSAIDLLENDRVFFDVIIPQTVLEEVRNRSFPIYTRLRALCSLDSKRFVVFHNEFHALCYVKRLPQETINDRNDRAIRKCCEFFSEHLKQNCDKPPSIVFVCNDKKSRKLLDNTPYHAASLLEYVESLPDSDSLVDLVPDPSEGPVFGETRFPEYYSASRLAGGVKNGALHKGNITISSYNFLEGSVSVPAFKKPLIVVGRENLNRAFSGDQVVVELLPESQWKVPSSEIVEESTLDAADNADGSVLISDKERIERAKRAQNGKAQPTAKVVGILKRSWRPYVGQIAQTSVARDLNAARSVFVVLSDRSLPRVRIRTRKAASLLGQRIVVSVDSWPSTLKYPEGHFVRSLGQIESVEAETEALLLEHSVEHAPFSKKVLDCLPKDGHLWTVEGHKHEESFKKRVDLTDKLVCSIDPPGCVDIDDALHAEPRGDGTFEVGVHIADVTHFVKPATAIDAEGASRGTSVYLVDKRIDMLPMLLGTDLCSLKLGVERFAFSVVWILDLEAKILDVKFHKSVIRSRESFSYEAAQKRIDDKNNKDDLTNGMRILLKLLKKLRAARMAAGALNLASPEVKVHMDSETADPGEVEIKELYETNSLVEEFMLLANISVARKIYDAFPQTAMLRRHAAPPVTNFEALNDMLRVRKNMLILLDLSKALADSLDRCEDPKDPYFNTLLRIMATRCMMAAEYFPSGMYSYSEFRHYGLATDIYTHFTSPIRRYCDVVAHRQLAAAIGYEPLDFSHRDKDKMEMICKNINKRHRNAQFAGRASIEYYVGQVMKNNSGETQEGYVIKVFLNGIVVLVPKFGVEGLIKLDVLGREETAKFDEERYELSFEDKKGSQRTVSVFEKVRVGVRSVLDEVSGKRRVQMVLE